MKQHYRGRFIEVAVKPPPRNSVFTPRALIGWWHGDIEIQIGMNWPESPCVTQAEAERRALLLARKWVDAHER